MARIVDSGVLIDWERRGRPITALRGAVGEPFAIASITATELLAGVYRAVPSPRRERRLTFVESVFAVVPVLPFDLAAARLHARRAAELRAVGPPWAKRSVPTTP
jgi:predicted nucleic acid-binding protein